MNPNDAFGKLYVEQVRDRSIASFDGRVIPELLLKDQPGEFEQVIDLTIAHIADVLMAFLTHPNHNFALVETERIDGNSILRLTPAHDDPDLIKQDLDDQVLAIGRANCLYFLCRPTDGARRRRSSWMQLMHDDAESMATLFVAFVVDEVSAAAMIWIQNHRFEFDDSDTTFVLKTDSAHNNYLDEGGWRDTYSRYPTKID